MGKKLEGQTILVTGAGRGLGASFCHIAAPAGAHVLALGRQEAALTHLITSLPGAGVLLFVGALAVLAIWWIRAVRVRSGRPKEAP